MLGGGNTEPGVGTQLIVGNQTINTASGQLGADKIIEALGPVEWPG